MAAVHAGVIDRDDGGTVRIEMTGPQDSYTGSTRNGVTSEDWPEWPGSYRVLDG
jgi:hypothetical protein